MTGGADDNSSHEAALATALDRFAAAWESGDGVPRMGDYLHSATATSDRFRIELVTELVKLDLEYRWQRGLSKLIEDYNEEDCGAAVPVSAALVLEEFRIRRAAGDVVTAGEYHRRFPQLSREIAEVLKLDPAISRSVAAPDARAGLQHLRPGEQIDDFDLLIQLGQGSFATVFLARQRSMQRLVALKISDHRGAEPQTLAKLDHNSIVRVYDQRTLENPPLRLMYMQYAAGGTLADVIRFLKEREPAQWSGRTFLDAIDQVLDSRGEAAPVDSAQRTRIRELTWPQLVCHIGSQLARAIEYAHQAGVLHRDIKPANVLLTADGVPKLADFNISFGATVAGTTAEENFGGSLAYMSPEQLDATHPGRSTTATDLDGRSDQFSLGVVLFELLTGRRPYRDETGLESWTHRLESMAGMRREGVNSLQWRLTASAQECGLPDLLRSMLAAKREDRHPTAGVVAAELELCLQPAARKLLAVEPRGLKALCRNWPVASVVAATVVPNAVAAAFNFLYNRGEIRQLIPDAEPVFMRIQSIINAIAFPVGMICVGLLMRSVMQMSRPAAMRVNRGNHDTRAASGAEQRAACLQLGARATLIGLTLWLIAAVAYPILLQRMVGTVPDPIFLHFVASLILCGLIAAAYPFLGVSLIVLRCLIPEMIRRDALTAADLPALLRLGQRSWIALSLAAAVPMMAVLILALSGLDRREALVVLAAGGTFGFGLAVIAFRTLQQDVQTLLRLAEKAS